ncbi:MAG: YcxB family protein [Clostridia bacterium]|nr:YcxB family protein [Clostridia bacterium]
MIEFKTQIDLNSQKVLNKYAIKKIAIIFSIFSLILIGIGVIGIVFAEDSADASTGIFLIILGVLLTPLLLIINALGQRSVARSSNFLNGQTKEIYRFNEEGFEHLQKKGESFFSHTKADYTYFYKIISTPTHYLMYITDRRCHVIDKSHITQGTCEELDEILTRKMPVGKFKKTKR